jgi:cell division protein FtsL
MISIYRLFKQDDGEAAPVRVGVIALIATAVLVTAVALVQISRQHEVLQLGYQLSRSSDHVRQLREAHRRLELERATLTAPDRIRRLATQLGMVAVPPDQIRVIDREHPGLAVRDGGHGGHEVVR